MAGPQVELLIRRPGHPERRVALEPGAYTLGRAEDSDIVLPDPGVSRRHARVVVGNEVIVEDTGSGNGTWMGTRKLSRYVASDGDELGIEPFTLVVRIAGNDAATEEGDAGATLVMPVPPPATPSAPVTARLEVISAHDVAASGLTLDANAPPHTLGRSEKCTITLPEPAASRVHAEVLREDRGWIVRDRNSANGTWVNGKRVREAVLAEHDIIRIGTVELRFTAQGKRPGETTEPGFAPPPSRAQATLPDVGHLPAPPAPAAPRPSPFAQPPAPVAPANVPPPLAPRPAAPMPPPVAASPFAQPPAPVAPMPVAPMPVPPATPRPSPVAQPPVSAPLAPMPVAPMPVPPATPRPSPFAQPPVPAPLAPMPVAPAPVAPAPVAQPHAPARGPAPMPAAPPFAHGPAHATAPHAGHAPTHSEAHARPPARPTPVAAPVPPPLPLTPETTDISPAPTPAATPAWSPPTAPAFAPPPPVAHPAYAPDEEIAIDPRSARAARTLRSNAPGAADGGFLSRRINQVTLGVGVLVLLMLGWKAVRDTGGAATPEEPAAASTGPASERGEGPASGSAPEGATPGGTPEGVTLSPAQVETLGAHMATGMAAFKERKHVEARRAFLQALEVDASNPDARRMAYLVSEALLLDAMRDVLVARNASDAQRREAKDTALSAVQAFAGGDADPVREAITKAEALNPGDAELAAATEQLDKKVSASAAAAGARREEKRRASLADLLAAGQRDFDRGEYAKAIATWNRLLEQDSTRSTQEYYQAEEQIRLAKDRAKSETKRAYADGITAFRAGEYMTARARLEEVVAVDPFNETAAQRLKECQTRLREQASSVFKEARVLEEEVRQPDKAIAAYQRVITLVRDPSDSLHQKAQARLDALLR